MGAWLEEMKDGRKETAACQEATEANPETMEANPDEMKSVTVHEEVPKGGRSETSWSIEEAAGESVSSSRGIGI
jgi:hypothetical protein